jgi:hypothetical protein
MLHNTRAHAICAATNPRNIPYPIEIALEICRGVRVIVLKYSAGERHGALFFSPGSAIMVGRGIQVLDVFARPVPERKKA